MASGITVTMKSPQACVFCRGRKQTCDKVMPRCSRCARKDRHCDYSPNCAVARRANGAKGAPSPAEEPVARVCEPCGCIEVTDHGESQIVLAALRSARPHLERGSELRELVLTLVDLGLGGLDQLIDRYFATQHRWLPIVSRHDLSASVDVGMSDLHSMFLLLSMQLIVQPRCATTHHHRPGCGSLHRLVKQLFALFQALNPSLDTLRAGLLIAAYECGHGLNRPAYQTLASCVAIARILGVDCHLAPALNSGSGERADPSVACWSAVVLLDRMIALMSLESSLPLLIPPPLDDTFDTYLASLEARVAASRAYEENHWSFEATAATAELIGEAITYAPSRSTVPLKRLDLVKSRTEKLVEVLLDISQAEPILTCEMAPFSISALALVQLECFTSGQEKYCTARAHDELYSTFQMVMEPLRQDMWLKAKPKAELYSLVALSSTFRTALYFVQHFRRDLLASTDLDRLRKGLRFFGEHWATGILYLEELDRLIGVLPGELSS